jgi:SAM-dependent methyltransferase
MTKATGFLNMIKNRLSRENIYNKADYWDAKAEELEGDAVSLWPNNNLNKLYEKEHIRFYDMCLGNINGLNAADVGCGVGNVTRMLAERGANVTGFDFSEKTVAIAIKKSVGMPNISFVVKSIFDFYEPNKYDLIHCRGCLTVACKDSKELKKCLKNISDSLKSRGKCVIIEPIHKGFLHRVLNIDLREFMDIMIQTGLEIKQVEQFHFVPARLVLCYFHLPMFITKPIYHLGQWFMHKVGWKWGDYKAIYAEKI